ncbi:MAG: TIGR04168 family protein, partial [Pseudanabaenaceae cyanobacterium bins.68]|nr:TIGR04168 family protein [Pseudanabaenaceae cyanobacterium bins.68]
MTPNLRIAIIGDVHDLWNPELDPGMLQALGVDLVLFVGDFGNEVVPLIRAIASLELPKAIILGNHDAWYSASDWGRKNCPYDRHLEDRVQQQLDLLGDTHVGYSRLDLAQFQLSIVGGRPFTWGGSEWKNQQFYRDRYGIDSFEESAARITANAASSPYDTVIFLGHNGPLGLGNQPQDICGKDWEPMAGDYGDPDLATAIAHTHKNIPLVTFGHMHHRLRSNGKIRTALVQV